ncbi:unnamed protein product [Schistocephalus solidus]|uniref:Uncharacterized protein n=1 Tax=Schistocephalus solidus TaxID=70667 RepID=A0A183TDB8_SCHSO|nr:unnamed protein product [Schistocephalus solidus]
MKKASNSGGRPPKPDKPTVYHDNDLWEDRMKVYMKAVDEGARPATIPGRLNNEVYMVASAANLKAFLTPETSFERLWGEFGRSSMPLVARATHTNRCQHAGDLPKRALQELKARVLENFIDGISPPEIRRQFLHDPPSSIKVARHEEAIHTACPLVQPSSPPAFVSRQAPAAIQNTSVDVFAMGQRQSRDLDTQTAQWQWAPLSPLFLGTALHNPPLLGEALHSLLDAGTGGNNMVVRPALRLPQVFM